MSTCWGSVGDWGLGFGFGVWGLGFGVWVLGFGFEPVTHLDCYVEIVGGDEGHQRAHLVKV